MILKSFFIFEELVYFEGLFTDDFEGSKRRKLEDEGTATAAHLIHMQTLKLARPTRSMTMLMMKRKYCALSSRRYAPSSSPPRTEL